MREVRRYLIFLVMLLLLLEGVRFLSFQNRIYKEAYMQLSRLIGHASIAVETGE